MHQLSVIIICKNEEKNISRCLRSLSFADEIVLVDSGSTDNTLLIAKKFQNVRIFQTEWMGFSGTKKFALAQTKFDWVFWIDADEAVSNELVQEWTSFSKHDETSLVDLKNPKTVAGIFVPRKTFFLGHFVRHSGWYPDLVLRFFNKKFAHFNEKYVHEGVIVDAGFKTARFTSHLFHYSYHSLKQFFDKMIYYGSLGAQDLSKNKKSIYRVQIFVNPLWIFFKLYFLKKGFLDGLIGLIICTGAAFSKFIKYSNYFFLKKYGYIENNLEQDKNFTQNF